MRLFRRKKASSRSVRTFGFKNDLGGDEMEMEKVMVVGDVIEVYLKNGGKYNLSSPQSIIIKDLSECQIQENNGSYNITLKSVHHPRFGERFTTLFGLGMREMAAIKAVI